MKTFNGWLSIALLSTVCACASAMPDDPGRSGPGYIGRIITEWLDDGRQMRILEPFAYIAQSGTRWDVPEGSIVDGASIPRFAWTMIGGPFEGSYREASVIHDVACVEKTRPWQDVHAVFYEAMRASGVGPIKAKVMYAAVYHFGPRWEHKVQLSNVREDEIYRQVYPVFGSTVRVETQALPVPPCTNSPCAPPDPRVNAMISYEPEPKRLTEEQFRELQAGIEAGEIDLGEIESYGQQ